MRIVFTTFLSLVFVACHSAAAVEPAVTPRPVTSFAECVAAGHPMLKTYPGRCVTPDGRVFVDTVRAGGTSGRLCVDRCGDGTCAEMVCLGEGCPCAESAASCPADCR